MLAQVKESAKAGVLSLTIVLLLAGIASAYTVVMRNGRRVEIGVILR